MGMLWNPLPPPISWLSSWGQNLDSSEGARRPFVIWVFSSPSPHRLAPASPDSLFLRLLSASVPQERVVTPASQRGVLLMEKAHKNLHLLFSSLVTGLWVPIWLQDGWNHRRVGLHLSRYTEPNAGPWLTSLPPQEGAGCMSYLVTYPRRHCFLLPSGPLEPPPTPTCLGFHTSYQPP